MTNDPLRDVARAELAARWSRPVRQWRAGESPACDPIGAEALAQLLDDMERPVEGILRSA